MSIPTLRSVIVPGLIGGLALNLIDTPWSVVVMVPHLTAFAEAHQLQGSPFVGPWFLMVHFGFCLTIAWFHALARPQVRHGPRAALGIGALFLILNRAFGLGNVLLGLMPLDVFLGFSVSFVVGVLAASWLIGWVMDRRALPPHAAA